MQNNRSVADSFGWPYPSRGLSVESLIIEYTTAGQDHASVHVVLAILRSIQGSELRDEIDVVCTSMWDLLVRPSGDTEPPFDVVLVSPSLEGATISHQSTTGFKRLHQPTHGRGGAVVLAVREREVRYRLKVRSLARLLKVSHDHSTGASGIPRALLTRSSMIR